MGKMLLVELSGQAFHLPPTEATTVSPEFFYKAGVEIIGQTLEARFMGLYVAEAPPLRMRTYALERNADMWNVVEKLGGNRSTSRDRVLVPITQIVANLEPDGNQKPVSMCALGKDDKVYLIVPQWDDERQGWELEAYGAEHTEGLEADDWVAHPL